MPEKSPADLVAIVEFLLNRIEHLESMNGQCKCFECFADRREHKKVMKEAQDFVDGK